MVQLLRGPGELSRGTGNRGGTSDPSGCERRTAGPPDPHSTGAPGAAGACRPRCPQGPPLRLHAQSWFPPIGLDCAPGSKETWPSAPALRGGHPRPAYCAGPAPTAAPSLLETGLRHHPRDGARAGGQRGGAPVHGECRGGAPPAPGRQRRPQALPGPVPPASGH